MLWASPRPGLVNQLVHDYVSHLRQLMRAGVNINRRLAALRSLIRLARSFDPVPWALDVRGERVRGYRDTRGPAVAGARRLAGAYGARTLEGRAIAPFCACSGALGLRRSEVAELDQNQVLRAVAIDLIDGLRQALQDEITRTRSRRGWCCRVRPSTASASDVRGGRLRRNDRTGITLVSGGRDPRLQPPPP